MSSAKTAGRNAFGALLGRTYRQWRRAADLRLQSCNLTEATWLPLLRIARAPSPPRQKDLAAALFVDGSAVVRLLDNLEQAGLIQRKEGATDRRAKTIHLTLRGRAIADKAETAARRIRQDALAGLSEQDIDTTTRVLEHICRVLDNSTEAAAA